MNNRRTIIINVLYIVMGITLIVMSLQGTIDDIYSSMGGALIAVGLLHLARCLRYEKNPAYREKVDTALSDERNHWLRMKAWSWAGYLFVIICGIGTITFMILEQELYMKIGSLGICLILVLYWVSYFVLSRRN